MDTNISTMSSLRGETGVEARRRIRTGAHRVPTQFAAPGYVQGNLAILPKALAADFARFCQLNPKPCPLLAQSRPGDPRLPTLGRDLDIRTDIPLYRVWKNGELIGGDRPQGCVARHSGVVRAGKHLPSLSRKALIERPRLRHHPQQQRADVPDQHRVQADRPFHGVDGGVDAALPAGRRDPRHPGDHALSLGAWRAVAYRQAD